MVENKEFLRFEENPEKSGKNPGKIQEKSGKNPEKRLSFQV